MHADMFDMLTLSVTGAHVYACRFSDIESDCAGGISTAPYGVDPVFKMGASAFNPDYDNERSLVEAYNCTELNLPEDEIIYNEQYPSPYCANLFNARQLPYGFFNFPLEQRTPGFPVWFDINLSEDQAAYWYRSALATVRSNKHFVCSVGATKKCLLC